MGPEQILMGKASQLIHMNNYKLHVIVKVKMSDFFKL